MAIVIEITDPLVETGLKLCGRREGKTIQQFTEESLFRARSRAAATRTTGKLEAPR
jgi:hypothetical protein